MKPGYQTSEFLLYAAAAGFSMWAGWYVLVHSWVEMERFLAVIGAVTAAAWAYGSQRTSLKRDVVAKEPPELLLSKPHHDETERV